MDTNKEKTTTNYKNLKIKRKRKTIKQRLHALGHWIFYVTMKFFGHKGAYILLWPVVGSYVIFSKRIHKITQIYLKKRFPNKRCYWLDTFKLVHSFSQVLVDRAWLGLNPKAKFEGKLEGLKTLKKLIAKGKGLILLTAHVGIWQVAFSNLPDLNVPVNVLMHYEEENAAKHYFDLRNQPCPFHIIRNDGFMGGLIEASAALSKGEIVTIMADRYVHGPYARVKFLGYETRVPIGAYMLAAITATPVVVLLTAKTGKTNYLVKIWDVFYPICKNRSKKEQEMQKYAQKFIDALEEYLKIYPYQWYNFYDFWKQ